MRWAALIMVAALGLAGCATSRSVVSPTVPKSDNPVQGQSIKVVKVEDLRHFEIAPDTPSIPSLSDDQIGDKVLTARAIARKRNGYGMALGDVLLPEQQTVAGLTQEAVEQAFRESGYRVVSSGQPGYDQAIPVTVRIEQFWAWMTPGFFAITLEHKSDLTLQAPIPPLQSGVRVQGYASNALAMAPESSWREIVSKGIVDLIARIKEKLTPAKVAATN